MFDAPFVMFDEDQRKIEKVLEHLVHEAHATSAFVIDKAGPLIAQSGSLVGIDTTGLASLTAGAIAATGGLAHLIGEDEAAAHKAQDQVAVLRQSRLLDPEQKRDHVEQESVTGERSLRAEVDERRVLHFARNLLHSTLRELVGLERIPEELDFFPL